MNENRIQSDTGKVNTEEVLGGGNELFIDVSYKLNRRLCTTFVTDVFIRSEKNFKS